jgi:hypothetical protein
MLVFPIREYATIQQYIKFRLVGAMLLSSLPIFATTNAKTCRKNGVCIVSLVWIF